MRETEQAVARALLDIKAVGFALEKPITFKSGILSPVYVDNRSLPFHPQAWDVVITGFKELIEAKGIRFDVLAGVEAAGIPHSAALGYSLQQPSVFVRKQVKDHGTKSRIEKGDVRDKKILLIEDHITTADSSLSSIDALRAEGALATECLAITTYGFAESTAAMTAAGVTLHTLTTFATILEQAVARDLLTTAEQRIIEDWLANPRDWKGP